MDAQFWDALRGAPPRARRACARFLFLCMRAQRMFKFSSRARGRRPLHAVSQRLGHG
jgi:hypothetical protein